MYPQTDFTTGIISLLQSISAALINDALCVNQSRFALFTRRLRRRYHSSCWNYLNVRSHVTESKSYKLALRSLQGETRNLSSRSTSLTYRRSCFVSSVGRPKICERQGATLEPDSRQESLAFARRSIIRRDKTDRVGEENRRDAPTVGQDTWPRKAAKQFSRPLRVSIQRGFKRYDSR
jgi:hypothetical protein